MTLAFAMTLAIGGGDFGGTSGGTGGGSGRGFGPALAGALAGVERAVDNSIRGMHKATTERVFDLHKVIDPKTTESPVKTLI